MFQKSSIISLTFAIFILIAISNCSSSIDPKTNKNPATPTPGTALTATGTGSTIAITWGEASSISGSAGLTYKLVKSSSPITDADSADLLSNVIQNYKAYNADTVYDVGVSSGVYYYNVIVKDAEGNKALYTGASAEAVADETAPDPGSSLDATAYFTTITITWNEADDNSLPAGLTYKVVRAASAISSVYEAENDPSVTVVNDYSKYGTGTVCDTGVAPGEYYYTVVVKDESGNKALYPLDYAEAMEDTSAPNPGLGTAVLVNGTDVTITWGEAEDNSLEAGLAYKVVRSAESIDTLEEADAATAVSGYAAYSSTGVTDAGLEPGDYYYNVIVKDESGNRSIYTSAWVNITETGYSVSGLITLPDTTSAEVNVYIDTDSNIDNGYLKTVKATLKSGLVYTYTFSGIFNGSYYIYVIVDNNEDGTSPGDGDYFGYYGGTDFNPPESAVIEVYLEDKVYLNILPDQMPCSDWYTVSGTIASPAAIDSGYYYIAFDGDGDLDTADDLYFASGAWNEGDNSTDYAVSYVPAGSYYVFVLVQDYPGIYYKYQSTSASLKVVNADITGKNFTVTLYQ